MENKISLSSLASNLAQTTGKTKKLCDDFLKEFFRVVVEALEEGETLKIKGFGTFKLTEVESRVGVNVTTGERQEISSYKKVVFMPSKELATIINAPFQDFETVEMEDEMPDEIFETEVASEDIKEEKEVDLTRLEQGSAEEGEDDEITLEAYELEEVNSEAQTGVSEPEGEQEEEKSESRDSEEEINSELSGQSEAESPNDDEEPATPHEEPKNDETQIVETQNVVSQIVETQNIKSMKSRFGLGFLLGAVSMFAVCVVIFTVGCFCGWWPVNFGNPHAVDIVAVQPVPVDTETVPEEETAAPQEEETPVVYDTVSKTRYLTTIAQEHYGNYNMWPYIYKENEAILGHPNRITPGTQVVVPDLKKYGVDPNNKDDVKEAKRLGHEIYSRYK